MKRLLLLIGLAAAIVPAVAQQAWYELRPEFGYIWLDGKHTDKGFYNRLAMEKIDSVTYTALISKVRSPDGAGVRFNGGQQLYMPAGENDIIQLSTINVPLADIRQGANDVRFESFHSEGQKYNNASHIIRMFFDRDDPPEGVRDMPKITFHTPPANLGEAVTLAAEVQDYDGIARVEYWVYADFFPTVNTRKPEFRQWHKVAEAQEYPFSATWHTAMYPDQSGMKLMAVVYDNEQIAVASPVSEGHTFKRTLHTTRHWDEDIEKISFWKQESNADTVYFDVQLPGKPQQAFVKLFAWLAADGYYTEGPLGALQINDGKPVDFFMKQDYPDAWTAVLETAAGDWKNGRNRLILTTHSPFKKSLMFSTPPGPVVYFVHP